MPNLPNVPWEKKHETDVVWGNRRLVSFQFNISCLLQPTSTLLLIEDEHKKDDLTTRTTSSAILIILCATKKYKKYIINKIGSISENTLSVSKHKNYDGLQKQNEAFYNMCSDACIIAYGDCFPCFSCWWDWGGTERRRR